MPLELQIIRAAEFIRLGAEGKLDVAASRGILRGLAAACRKRGITRALLDLRKVPVRPTPAFSPSDLASLVNAFREMGFRRDQRLALLYSADPHHRARLFALISTLRGWSVKAFDDFETAIGWLNSADPEAAEHELQTEECRVPVRSRKSAVKRLHAM